MGVRLNILALDGNLVEGSTEPSCGSRRFQGAASNSLYGERDAMKQKPVKRSAFSWNEGKAFSE